MTSHQLVVVGRKNSMVYSSSAVLYGYETWSFTLREERRLRVSDNGVQREIFGAKGD